MAKYQYVQNAFHSDLKPRARLVLNCLIMHANKDGECFPSIKTIAAECGYGVSTVKRALNDLCEAGYLQKQARFDERKKGGQTSNLYTLTDIDGAPTEQSEASVKKEIPRAEKSPARDQCVGAFTYSFPGVFRQADADRESILSGWTAPQAILIPP